MDVIDAVRKWYVCVWYVSQGQPEQIKAWEHFGSKSEAQAHYRSLRQVNFEGELGGATVTYNDVLSKCPSTAVNVSMAKMNKWLRLSHMEDWLKSS